MTYGELERASDACAAAFAALGIRRGDRVGLLLPNCPQFFVAELGAWKLGAIVAPLNPIYTEHELEGPIRDHGIETLVTLTRFYRRVKNIQPRTGLRRVVATNIKEHFPPILRLLFTLVREKRDGDRITLEPGDLRLRDAALGEPRPRGRNAPRLRAHDPAVLLMSGGTTGTPKGVVGTHGAYVIAGLQIRKWNEAALRGADDVILLPLPMFHVYGNVGVQALALISRQRDRARPEPARPARSARDDPPRQADLLQRRADALHRAPQPPGRPERQGRLQVDPHLLLRRRAAARGNQGALRSHHRRPHRRGLLADRSDDGAVREPGEGTEQARLGRACRCPTSPSASSTTTRERASCGVNEVGEIAIAAPQLMLGYWNRAEETANVLRDHTIDGVTERWLHTGDLGYLDADGYLFIVDRKKDLIKTSGYQVWPREIEEVIAVASGGGGGRRRRRARREQGRSGQGVGRAPRRADGHRGGAAGVLPREARAVQGAREGRVPDRAAEDDGRQGAAPRAQRRSALVVFWSNFAELDSISLPRRLVAAERD